MGEDGEWATGATIMVRQKNVCLMLQTVTNWQKMLFSRLENSEAYEERVATLKLLGIEVGLVHTLISFFAMSE